MSCARWDGGSSAPESCTPPLHHLASLSCSDVAEVQQFQVGIPQIPKVVLKGPCCQVESERRSIDPGLEVA